MRKILYTNRANPIYIFCNDDTTNQKERTRFYIMNTENNNGLYPHQVAKQLYKSGKMPYWAYVQLYATKEEAIEIYEERRKQIIKNINQ